jgi:hypothetical protein
MAVELTADDEAQVEAFVEKQFMAALAAMELANIELGVRLHLYEALTAGPLTADGLAAAAGIAPRYAREWLEQQATARVVEVEEVGSPDERRYSLPAAHAHCLLEDDSEACVKPMSALVPWLAGAVSLMAEEFRDGKGLPFGAFDLHDIQAAFTRPVFVNHLVQSWLPAVADVHARLNFGDAVRIAEVGSGEGLAAITIAKAYPNATVDGYDLDDASVAAARKAAADAGVADRVQFHLADAGTVAVEQPYDLVLSIEMLHDVPDPVAILTSMKRLAGDSGAVVVADERTKDTLTIDDDPMERFFYTFSTLHCLAVSMQGGGAGTGTVIRESTVRDYAASAGFPDVEVLDVDHPQFKLYRLR